MNLFPNQIIRNHPLKDGSFSLFKVKGHVLNMIEVREINRETGEELLIETEFWHPSDVELYSFASSHNGKISIGDIVECFGIEGQHVIKSFTESPNDETMAVIVKDGVEKLWYAHYCRKV
jgi:hypothetical protein